MNDIVTCQVLNEADKESITLCAEWSNDHVTIYILKMDTLPLIGEMSMAQLKDFAENFPVTFDEYIEETRNMLAGKDTDVSFFLIDDMFKWSKRLWTRGKIMVHPVSKIETISDILHRLINNFNDTGKMLEELKQENDKLKSVQQKLNDQLQTMISLKNSIEKDLYAKFLLLLNSKKRKIKELQEESKEQSNVNSAYNAPTDESEGSEEDTSKSTGSPRKRIKNKVVSTASTSKMTGTFGTLLNNENANTPHKEIEEINEKPIDKVEQKANIRSQLTLLENDSEEDMFS
ncbi:DNA repair protein XRCC4 [Orussus abietinus]|uniref:DNA repair protein XRCC4 n=1 Tax=Orussus abietinus TaxID=222816 RepID=UPI000626B3BA|nr:DNA repair protein XRCC4 [Orussus abietinus]